MALSLGLAQSAIVLDGPAARDSGRQVVPKPVSDTEAEAPSPAATLDTLKFFNGDTLHGTLVAIDPVKGVLWRSPEARTDLEFYPKNIAKISLAKTNKPATTARTNLCLVRLTNGDEMLGHIRLLDADKLVLETWYAGPLIFPRKFVRTLGLLQQNAGVLYEGPTTMEGWTCRGRQSWKYADGSFTTTRPGFIGRDVKLPPLSHVEFELGWRGQLQFLVNVYTDSLEEYGSNCYLIQMNAGYVYLQRVRRTGGSSNLGQVEVPALGNRNRARVDLFVNKEQRALWLVVDGTLVKQWKDSGEFAGLGTGLIFYQQSVNFLKLSNIRVTDWDGRLEDRLVPAETKAKDDLVELANRDKISGTLQTIKDGRMAFVTAFANMDIPVDRLLTVELAGEKSPAAERRKGEIRAVFAERGSLTFLLDKWGHDQVLARSPNFGQARFAPAAFNQIHFNLDEQRKSELEIFEPMDEGEQ